MYRLFQVVTDPGGFQHRHRVLGERLDDGDNVHFLHAKLPHAERRSVGGKHPVGTLDLSGEKQHRCGIQPGACQPRNRIRSTRACCHHGHTQVIGGLGIVLGSHGGGLLVRITNRFDVFALRQRCVQVHGAAASNQEYVLHSLVRHEAHYIIGELDHEFRIQSTSSRTAPLPPFATVTIAALLRTEARASAGAAAKPANSIAARSFTSSPMKQISSSAR